jgi:2-polyprenyl-3-methyl-5-hydroxy-6-metoxy-1,4-benzoquinol methylase
MSQKKVVFEEKLTWLEKNANPDFWDKHWLNENKPFLYKTRLPWYVRRVLTGVTPYASIIEAGCGSGFIVRALANRGYKVFGVDIAEKTISILKSSFPHLKFSHQDVRALNFEDNKFDVYLSLGVIEHFPNEKDALSVIQEAIRVTKPAGIIFISVPFTNRLREKKIRNQIYDEVKILPNDFYQRSYTILQFEQLISGLSLKLEEVIYYDAIGGLSREIIFFNFLKDSLVIKILFNLLNSFTTLFDSYTHMVGFKLLNNKVSNYQN